MWENEWYMQENCNEYAGNLEEETENISYESNANRDITYNTGILSIFCC